MTPLKRSRRLQAGVVGLSVLSALGAAVGLGLTTHTDHSSQSGNGGSGANGAQPSSHRIGDDDEEGRGEGDGPSASRQNSQQNSHQNSQVTPPSTSAPQATTSGS